MERSYEAQKRQAHVKQLRKLASTLPFSITEEIDALRPDLKPSGYHLSGQHLDEDMRATIVAAATILTAAQAALSLRRGGDGIWPSEVTPVQPKSPNGAGVHAQPEAHRGIADQRELTAAERAGRMR